MVKPVERNMPIKIYADGADLNQMIAWALDDRISGLTCNPSLMRAAGITNYALFAREVLEVIHKPVSFEVFADDFDEMERQARLIASWGDNVYVKIPVTNTKEESSTTLIKKLSDDGIKLNITAIFSCVQIDDVTSVLNETPAIISIFAGRIADTGRDPAWLGGFARTRAKPNTEILWASTRELLNIKQAERCKFDIITVPDDLLKKLHLFGKDLTEYSRETVRMFYDDAKASGYVL